MILSAIEFWLEMTVWREHISFCLSSPLTLILIGKGPYLIFFHMSDGHTMGSIGSLGNLRFLTILKAGCISMCLDINFPPQNQGPA